MFTLKEMRPDHAIKMPLLLPYYNYAASTWRTTTKRRDV